VDGHKGSLHVEETGFRISNKMLSSSDRRNVFNQPLVTMVLVSSEMEGQLVRLWAVYMVLGRLSRRGKTNIVFCWTIEAVVKVRYS
jgi:hypothetical protein